MEKPSSASARLGRFLKEKRKHAGFSQADVSQRLGYASHQFISNWERGVSAPPAKIIVELARLYEVETEVLFSHLLAFTFEQVERNMTKEVFGRPSSKTRSIC